MYISLIEWSFYGRRCVLYRDKQVTDTSITTTTSKFSSASIGASFAPHGVTDISVSANKGNGNSKESLTAYSPTIIAAEHNLSLTSGKDMDIIGSRAQGDRITASVGGNLNIETPRRKRPMRSRIPLRDLGFLGA